MMTTGIHDHDQLGPEMVGLVPDLAKFVPPARTFDKHVYSPWTGSDLHGHDYRSSTVPSDGNLRERLGASLSQEEDPSARKK